jgi:hypothetical protein
MLEPDDEGRQFRGVPYVFDIAADRRARQEAWDSLEEVEEYEVREDGDEGDDEG